MNLFKRKSLPDVSLTGDAYRRWLRAHSPQPLSFFLGLTEAEQETLAGFGEDYDEDGYIALAYAIRDPEAAAFGATVEGEDNDLGIEEALVQRMAATIATRAAQNAQEAAGSTQVRNPPSMAGITKRRAEADLEDKRAQGRGRRLMGREPDDPGAVAQPQPVATSEPFYDPALVAKINEVD